MANNIYQPSKGLIANIKTEAPGIKRFTIRPELPLQFQPGQIIEISIPGFGESPVAPCSNPERMNYFDICVKATGNLTKKLHELHIGDYLLYRGPYGAGWPTIKQKELLMVVGGIGLIPLKPLLLARDRYLPDVKINLFYGAKTPSEFIFKNNLEEWKNEGINVIQSIDKPNSEWQGEVGLVTVLCDKYPVGKNSAAFLCGPPIMYRFVLEKIKQIETENIYISLERRMQCGVGVCQHCAVGSYYTCVDGPVFKYDQLKNIYGAI